MNIQLTKDEVTLLKRVIMAVGAYCVIDKEQEQMLSTILSYLDETDKKLDEE